MRACLFTCVTVFRNKHFGVKKCWPKINQSWNKLESSFSFIAPACQKRWVLEQLQTCEFSIHHSVFLEWLSLSIVCSSWPQTVTTLSGWIWLLLFISCHFPSDQIQGVGCLHSLVSVLSGLTSPPPQRASLTLPVKSSSSCCHSSPALSHRSGSNVEKAATQQARQRDVYVTCVSPQ